MSRHAVAVSEPTASRTLDVRNPRSGITDYRIECATSGEIAALAGALRVEQPSWAAAGFAHRAQALLRFADALQERRESLIAALTVDTGRAAISAGEVDSAIRNIRRWAVQAESMVVESEFPSKLLSTVTIRDQFVPYPLAGCISPWNFPVTLSFIDAVPALMAGCACIVKPSEVTPRFVAPVREALDSVPQLAAVLRFVLGDADTGRALVNVVDVVCFTGSVATGRKVAEAAASRFIPAFLELGGKDPAIVLETADLDMATDVVLRGSIANNGHACMSLERIYVARSIFQQFAERLVEKAGKVTLAWPDVGRGYLGPLIFDRQAAIIEEQLQDALAKGARALTGGRIEKLDGGLYCRPTVLVGVDHTMRIMRDETFGPVIPLMPFDTVDEAVDLANDSDFGLSACVLAGTVDEAIAVGRRIDAGGISINDGCMTYMTYEGEKNSFKFSGLGGSRMGAQGLRRFFRRKALIIQHGRAAGVPAG
jgi:acyl-CoA reductase-like NAD-dependent aldehyde dehydrogenase